MSGFPILATRGLIKRFGGVAAVDGVDLIVDVGEIRCLIGPNGAGKSTLFKCLTHQHQPTSGHVLFEGRDLQGLPTHRIARRGIAIKNQIPSIYANLDVRENIRLAALRRKLTKRELDSAVDLVLAEIGFDDLLARRPAATLSHAHRQWCELGMLLASDPRLALLDEPTAGMTREEMLKTVDIIKRLNARATVIVVEHDLEFIARLAQKVTVLHRGKVLVEDSMERIEANATVRDIYLGRKKDAAHAEN
ncbi:ATP-binding cassette domain-containing protein [Bradyrhizobium sp. SBR1B]|uniref:ATP-binding cassette domain-containing protein n=1 Tax=Bradyrhizobium sp. SBR1B TaxID=2663836 RepID=UPI001606BE85|nr:ATP-binding cassette domain-containing protein [Bradyrhizobium sp. SBR1B]MBB4380250.1 branched-chain amino acid transport system ATP-binding protein/urea transport system ATP-binding protein [Bradyrhizobium sp. SBR1B]